MIKFGTDGFRGIISYNFNFDSVKRIAYSISESLNGSFAVGYDGRFLSKEFASIVASIIAGRHKTFLSNAVIPTPAISLFMNRKKIDFGCVITASHNPYYYNGFKLKKYPGMSAGSDTTEVIERNLTLKCYTGIPEEADIKSFYIAELKKRFKFKRKFFSDSMYGATAGITKEFGAVEIRNKIVPDFCGIKPEPDAGSVKDLRKLCVKNRKPGFAFDGDGDRILIVLENGRVLSTLESFSLFTYIALKKKLFKSGKILKTVSLGYTPHLIAADYGFEVEEVPVGFKHIAGRLGSDVVFGGEESGGIGWSFWIPERDGVFNGLLLFELLEGESIENIFHEIEKNYGRRYYKRLDLHMKFDFNKNMVDAFKDVDKVLDIDGYKLYFKDTSWVLFRRSGTEPLLRIYVEAVSRFRLNEIYKKVFEVLKLPSSI